MANRTVSFAALAAAVRSYTPGTQSASGLGSRFFLTVPWLQLSELSPNKKDPSSQGTSQIVLPPYFAGCSPICRRGCSSFSIGGGPWSTVAPCRGPLTAPNRHSLVRAFTLRSACSSRVHSFFRSERRLTPYPARFALLEDYYSPS